MKSKVGKEITIGKTNPADEIERWSLDKLTPYARNSRTHSDEQVAQLAASIREWGWTTPVLVDEDGGIIAGHGRVLAARQLGMVEVPVVVARGWSDAKRRAYVIADNKLALNAGWDADMLSLELGELGELGFDLDLTGFGEEEIKGIDEQSGATSEAGEAKELDGETYTKKIEAPIYEPKGDRPKVEELFDNSKAKELVREIDAAKLPPDVSAFLRLAAERHTVFNFRNIAEFYAHADEKTQGLFERSALVIIDFDKAIENGFVHLTERLGKLADAEGWNGDAS
jgi:ParB-like chromosome segregation protein Spo0J